MVQARYCESRHEGILVVTFGEVRFVVLDCMELGGAARMFRWSLAGWSLLCQLLPVALFLRET